VVRGQAALPMPDGALKSNVANDDDNVRPASCAWFGRLSCACAFPKLSVYPQKFTNDVGKYVPKFNPTSGGLSGMWTLPTSNPGGVPLSEKSKTYGVDACAVWMSNTSGAPTAQVGAAVRCGAGPAQRAILLDGMPPALPKAPPTQSAAPALSWIPASAS